MKKIIFLGCLLVLLCCAGYAAHLTPEQVLSKEIERQLVNRRTLVPEQLKTISNRLLLEMDKEATPQQIVRWLYSCHTSNLKQVIYEQFKWERSQAFETLLTQPGHEEELAALQEYIPLTDPRVAAYGRYWKHVIDYSFASVFSASDLEHLFVYGNQNSNYDKNAYDPLEDVAKFKQDTKKEMDNIYGLLDFLANGEKDAFHSFWSAFFDEE